jgi:AAA domain/DnaB-like helicase N terminal domain
VNLDEVTVPAAPMAEAAALGAVLQSSIDPNGTNPDRAALVARELFATAPPETFWRPAHQSLAAVIDAMVAAEIPVDPQTVLARWSEAGEATRWGSGVFLQELMGQGWSAANVGYYAAEIREAWRRRRIQVEGVRLVQQSSNPEIPTADLLLRAAALYDEDQEAQARLEVTPSLTLADVQARPRRPKRWLIEGLIAEKERTIVTGVEGLGKSELVAQVAVGAAAGVHPFTEKDIPAKRVLVLDCENPLDELEDRYLRIAGAAELMAPGWDRTRLMLEVREAGVDLLKADEVAWLDRLLRTNQPDLLVTGPLYKMQRSDLNKEEVARQLTANLDDLRVRHNVALLIEAHPGQLTDGRGTRQLRPRGSSLLLGWPSVGLGLRAHKDANRDPVTDAPDLIEVRRWRGMRARRDWPSQLHRGGEMTMPWVPPRRVWTPSAALAAVH